MIAKLHDKIYDYLLQEFREINSMLDDYGKVELDGKLWKLSAQLDEFVTETALSNALAESAVNFFTNREKRVC